MLNVKMMLIGSSDVMMEIDGTWHEGMREEELVGWCEGGYEQFWHVLGAQVRNRWRTEIEGHLANSGLLENCRWNGVYVCVCVCVHVLMLIETRNMIRIL